MAAYVRAAGLPGVVCFTCGHAAEELRRAGLDVVEIGPAGDLGARAWWPASRIAATWPHLLDATSGHMPAPIMADIAVAFRREMGDLDPDVTWRVPTGSGETIVCLAWAYPHLRFVAVYDARQPATAYDRQAPLNGLVESLAWRITGRPRGAGQMAPTRRRPARRRPPS